MLAPVYQTKASDGNRLAFVRPNRSRDVSYAWEHSESRGLRYATMEKESANGAGKASPPTHRTA